MGYVNMLTFETSLGTQYLTHFFNKLGKSIANFNIHTDILLIWLASNIICKLK